MVLREGEGTSKMGEYCSGFAGLGWELRIPMVECSAIGSREK